MADSQRNLFDAAERIEAAELGREPVPHNRTDTSKAAAERIEPRVGSRRGFVLRFIRRRGSLGATNNEIAEALGLMIQSVCPVTNSLWRAGFLEKSESVREGCRAWRAV